MRQSAAGRALSSTTQVLTAAELAPGTEATWDALTDPAKRPPEAWVATPAELLQYQPECSVQLSTRAVASALREARRGGAAGLSGMRAEHLKLLLQDLEALELLAEAATHLAQAHVPADVVAGLAMARLTALRKPDGGVRGIATSDVSRRLVARTLAKEWAQVFDNATRPYQCKPGRGRTLSPPACLPCPCAQAQSSCRWTAGAHMTPCLA